MPPEIIDVSKHSVANNRVVREVSFNRARNIVRYLVYKRARGSSCLSVDCVVIVRRIRAVGS